jgi:hypothetical protein
MVPITRAPVWPTVMFDFEWFEVLLTGGIDTVIFAFVKT